MTNQHKSIVPGTLDVYPVLPLRDIVVFPHMIVPLFVGREKSIRALEEVMKSDKPILLATQKNAADDDPAPDAIFSAGTLASVLQLLKLPDGTVKVLVEGSTRAQVTTAPRFKAGDKVVARNINPPTHTRLPRYIRGKHGVVQHNHGGFAFADTRAHGLGDQPHHVYSVRFEARELWGDDDAARDAVYIDLWEPYIEPAA